MSGDAIAAFKEAQRQGWKHFAPLEALTTPPAARLVNSRIFALDKMSSMSAVVRA